METAKPKHHTGYSGEIKALSLLGAQKTWYTICS